MSLGSIALVLKLLQVVVVAPPLWRPPASSLFLAVVATGPSWTVSKCAASGCCSSASLVSY